MLPEDDKKEPLGDEGAADHMPIEEELAERTGVEHDVDDPDDRSSSLTCSHSRPQKHYVQ